ncbi:MAG: ComF family protein [Flavobacteriaceae bacterium]|nr:ComF family protein [Flavobacteriaceae bacterium]
MYAHFVNLLFPNVCRGCSQPLVNGEEHICAMCISELPLTGYIGWNENPVAKRLWGRVNLIHASSFMHFVKDSMVQQLLHNLKYKGQKEIGFALGKLLGNELLENEKLNDVDYVVPVPMYPRKERKRGYNQAWTIAKGVSDSISKPIEQNSLVKILDTRSQTRLNRWMRWENQQEIFALKNASNYEGKHILLVDDVITTGSTLEACTTLMNQVDGCRVSVATLACAS